MNMKETGRYDEDKAMISAKMHMAFECECERAMSYAYLNAGIPDVE